MEEMEFIVDAAMESMEQAVVHLEKEMLNIRAGFDSLMGRHL